MDLKNEKKPTFLLSKALCISCAKENNDQAPNPVTYSQLDTGSKTFAAPADDDPDPDAEICY